jgi:hypothetical protein
LLIYSSIASVFVLIVTPVFSTSFIANDKSFNDFSNCVIAISQVFINKSLDELLILLSCIFGLFIAVKLEITRGVISILFGI